MHTDELAVDKTLVKHLIGEQFPHWTNIPIDPVLSSGTDNAMFRLAEDMVARLPRLAVAAEQVQREQRWLPELAPHLPLAIPRPIGMGSPTEKYPWHWSIYTWLGGDNALTATLKDSLNS